MGEHAGVAEEAGHVAGGAVLPIEVDADAGAGGEKEVAERRGVEGRGLVVGGDERAAGSGAGVGFDEVAAEADGGAAGGEGVFGVKGVVAAVGGHEHARRGAGGGEGEGGRAEGAAG
jgi:hypothetical protein